MLLSRLKISLLVVVSITVIFFTTTQAFADMFGFSKKQDFTLSVPISGQLLNDGKPLANITIFKSFTFGDEYLDETTSDDNGNFSFPERVIKTSKPANMFDNGSLIQHIYIKKDNSKDIVLWFARIGLHKQSKTLNEYLNNLVCDIAKEPQTYDIPVVEDKEHVFTVYTACKI
ncbi:MULTISPECIES: DUF6795 domain-containing protein [Pseudoalteromonas]|uniref:DUF6795 domain-containing protein n=1 Tax=Pseudoalteromonas fuliginea TaxID=1872678 RepID=A0ABD3YE06_9GAMM|nr:MULTISPECIES: DUF6795 domain-containing protein [Pseudoalteromonas]KDC53114.1 hypothetical protein DC53_02150 [Pseudoalteromonas fuliginea]GAA78136.1 hypothetical protein P20495_0626 [Pseudoalteromonas sp. BSi20495]